MELEETGICTILITRVKAQELPKTRAAEKWAADHNLVRKDRKTPLATDISITFYTDTEVELVRSVACFTDEKSDEAYDDYLQAVFRRQLPQVEIVLNKAIRHLNVHGWRLRSSGPLTLALEGRPTRLITLLFTRPQQAPEADSEPDEATSSGEETPPA